jgi:hypothetical protein
VDGSHRGRGAGWLRQESPAPPRGDGRGPAAEVPGRVAVAAEWTATPLAQATPVTDGWVFVARDGVVARSASWLGPLERVGQMPAVVFERDTARSGGRAVVRSNDAYWTNRGGTSIAPLAVPENTQTGAFATSSFGAAVTEGGGLELVRSGRWSRVDLGADAAWYVAPEGGHLVVQTTRGARTLGADGTLGGPTPAAQMPRRPTLDDASRRRLRDAIIRRHPGVLDVLGAVPVGGGGRLVLDEDQAAVYDDAGGLLLRRTSGLAGRCSLLPWGPTAVARCGDAFHRRALRRPR